MKTVTNNKWRNNVTINNEVMKHAHLHLLGYEITVLADPGSGFCTFSFYSPKDKERFSKNYGLEQAYERLDKGEMKECVSFKESELPMTLFFRACANRVPYIPGKLMRAFKKVESLACKHVFCS